MPSLPAALTAGTFVDQVLVDAASFAPVTALINAVRNRVNPLTSVWHAVFAGSGATMPDSTWTVAPLDTTLVDSDGLGIDTNGYRVPATGHYLLSGRVAITDPAGSSKLVAQIAVNGSRGRDGTRNATDQSGAVSCMVATGAVVYALNKGDLVTVHAWGNPHAFSAQTINTFGRCSLAVRRIT